MKQGQDIAVEFPGAVIVHQKIQSYAVDEHVHEDHELFLPLQGEITVRTGAGPAATIVKAGPGKMLYVPPKAPHVFAAGKNGSGERLIVILGEKLWRAEGGGEHPLTVCSASQLTKEILFQLLLKPAARAAPLLLRSIVPVLTEMLDEAAPAAAGAFAHLTGRGDDPRLKSALHEISRSYDQNLSAAALAKNSGMSVRTLNRAFLETLGLTPKQALTLRRVEEAKRLLQKRGATVTDVAFAVGYNSVSQFIDVFRRSTGQVPSAFLASKL